MSHEKYQEEARFLNEILPMDDDLVPPVKRGRKRFVIVLSISMFGVFSGVHFRRSGSIASSTTGEGEGSTTTAKKGRKGKAAKYVGSSCQTVKFGLSSLSPDALVSPPRMMMVQMMAMAGMMRHRKAVLQHHPDAQLHRCNQLGPCLNDGRKFLFSTYYCSDDLRVFTDRTRKPAVEIINISSDSDEGEDDEATPRDRRPQPKASNVKEEEEEHASHSVIGHDDGDSEEEDEVSGLLAEE